MKESKKEGRRSKSSENGGSEPLPIKNLRSADEEYLRPLPSIQGDFRWVILNVKDLSLIGHYNGNSKLLLESINECVKQTSHAHVLLVQMKDLLLCISHSGSKAPISDRTNLSFCIEYIKRYFAL
ncbi:hypothetical protein RFI_33340, partial [Reticulomyxa filosa]